MELYTSKTGETGTKAYWMLFLDEFWKDMSAITDKQYNTVKRPADAWERLVRVLKLEKV